jgi:hypothetical protein
MQVASTLQFRSAVRTIARANGFRIVDSYTNSRRSQMDLDRRTVGFAMPSASATVVAAVERLLNAQGLTANTRVTANGPQNGGCLVHGPYIRGTCVTA